MTTELMTIDDIAARIGMRRQYVRDTVVKRPDFPPPAIRLSAQMRQWAIEDVEAWFAKQRKMWRR